MAFNGYLPQQEIKELTNAADSGGLLVGFLGAQRDVLLSGIPSKFAAGLARADNPLDQFTLDLVRLNRVERMAGGEVPLLILLRNTADWLQLRDRVEAQVFERILNQAGNVAVGLSALPDPAQLPEVTRNERIIGTDDMVDIGFLASGLGVARAVALISVPRYEGGQQVMAADGSPWVSSGTAWLIAPGLAITNHHVINARFDFELDAGQADLERQALGASLRFDYDDPNADGTQIGTTSLVAWSRRGELDYALLEVDPPAGRPVPRIAPDLVQLDATSRSAVNIVQHPRARHKRVALRNNLVSGADATTLRYFTDTDSGSSGSPVCDDQWRVVALHRGARLANGVQYLGKDTAYVNFGSQIQAILTDLRAIAPTAAEVIAAGQ